MSSHATQQWWRHTGERARPMAMASRAQHSSTPTSFIWLAKLQSWRKATVLQELQNLGAFWGGFWHTSSLAERKAVADVQPTAWSTQHQETQNPRRLLVSFYSAVTLPTSIHRGHLWSLKPIQSSRRTLRSYKRMTSSSWGWHMPQDSVLCFLTIIWGNIQNISETGEFWGILTLLFWVWNYWHLALIWHHS